jgi:hypothetical protein
MSQSEENAERAGVAAARAFGRGDGVVQHCRYTSGVKWLVALLVISFAVVADAQEAGVSKGRLRPIRRHPAVWIPAQSMSWQIQLDGALDLTIDAEMYEIDGFDSDARDVAALHDAGRKVACYMNAGAWEEWRDDAARFPAAVIGNNYAGWPGEKWLDIRRLDLLAPILRSRFERCAQKGFDAIDPDNVDGYSNNTGFPLTETDQLTFNRFLASEAHALGMSIALKNDFDQAGELAADFDWVVAESCFHEGECGKLQPFLSLGKAVFDIEYTDEVTSLAQFCDQADALNLSVILKHRSLEAWRELCP